LIDIPVTDQLILQFCALRYQSYENLLFNFVIVVFFSVLD